MTADDEREHYITHAGLDLTEKGEIKDEESPHDTGESFWK